jgi:hypothetical protein
MVQGSPFSVSPKVEKQPDVTFSYFTKNGEMGQGSPISVSSKVEKWRNRPRVTKNGEIARGHQFLFHRKWRNSQGAPISISPKMENSHRSPISASSKVEK